MSGARLAYVNILARDIEALSAFYRETLGFPEIMGHRSPIYRCLDAGGMELGFNAPAAYGLLGLDDRRPGDAIPPAVAYFTFELASREAVAASVATALAQGGKLRKGPYLTYYNAWQAVMEDPEGNIFRLNHRIGPRTPADQVDGPWNAAPPA